MEIHCIHAILVREPALQKKKKAFFCLLLCTCVYYYSLKEKPTHFLQIFKQSHMKLYLNLNKVEHIESKLKSICFFLMFGLLLLQVFWESNVCRNNIQELAMLWAASQVCSQTPHHQTQSSTQLPLYNENCYFCVSLLTSNVSLCPFICFCTV